MTLYKKATLKAESKISNHVYVCSSCGHTEMTKKLSNREKICPKCDKVMEIMSSEED